MVHVITMTKHELVALGYGASRAQDIIRRAKLLMYAKVFPTTKARSSDAYR